MIKQSESAGLYVVFILLINYLSRNKEANWILFIAVKNKAYWSGLTENENSHERLMNMQYLAKTE